MKKLLFLFIALTAVVSFSQNEESSTPKITIKIALGETITIESYQIKFVKVLEDSRCPKNVTCIWAGRAKILVEVWENNEDSVLKELILGQVNQGESKDLTLVASEDKIIKGYTLKPYPSKGVPFDKKKYELLVYIKY